MNEDACAMYTYVICSKYRPEQLVFVDESSCDHWISREYGRAVRGHHVTKKTVFVRGKRSYHSRSLVAVDTYSLTDSQFSQHSPSME